MKILYIQANFGLGGINRITSVKEDYLVEHGYEVHNLNTVEEDIVSPKGMYSEKIHLHFIYKKTLDRLHSIKVVGRLLRYIYLRYEFLRVLWQVRPDIIVCTQPTIEPLSIIFLTFWKKRVLEFQGWYSATKKEQLTRLDKWYALTKYRIYHNVSLTSREAKHFEELTACHSLYINNANYMKFDRQADGNSKQVLIISRLSPQKGIAEFLPAWKKVEVEHPDWRLAIYGKGPEENHIREVIRENDLSHVELHAYTTDVISVYCESSIMLLPSRFEGWGLTLIESMSLGVPCIAYDCPYGPSDIIRNGEDGFLTEYMNPDAMADKINYLIEHSEIRKQMGARARINVQRFNVDRIMGQWMTLFENLKKGIFVQPD